VSFTKHLQIKCLFDPHAWPGVLDQDLPTWAAWRCCERFGIAGLLAVLDAQTPVQPD
jgi:hypothetical protein